MLLYKLCYIFLNKEFEFILLFQACNRLLISSCIIVQYISWWDHQSSYFTHFYYILESVRITHEFVNICIYFYNRLNLTRLL